MDRKFKVGDRVEFVRSDAPFYEGCTGEIVWIGTGDCPYPYMVKGEVCGHVRNCAVAEASLRLLESSADTDKPNHLYNVGDTVLIKSRQWYDANKDESGCIPSLSGGCSFLSSMAPYCGQTMKIAGVCANGDYLVKGNSLLFSDFMIERKVENDESRSCPFNPRLNSFDRDFRCQTPPMTDLPLIQNNKLLTDIQLD